MSDELHSRSTAAALLFTRELFLPLLELSVDGRDRVQKAVVALTEDHYFFLRLSMAAAKATADAAHGIEGSSMVTAMAFNCRNFAVRVSGLGDQCPDTGNAHQAAIQRIAAHHIWNHAMQRSNSATRAARALSMGAVAPASWG